MNHDDEELRRRDEERQRNIDFIIQQQAQFAADMQRMRETQERAEEKWQKRWEQTAEGIRDLLAIAEIHEREISAQAEAQAESQARTDRRIAETNERIAETNRQLAESNERLNALIYTVERYISERRNGGQNT